MTQGTGNKLDKNSEFRMLHMEGGAVLGLAQIEILIFLEETAGIPISWQYDMLSGDSVGSLHAAVANTPVTKDSAEPRYSMKHYKDVFKGVITEVFEPYRDFHHDQIAVNEGIRIGLAATADKLRQIGERADTWLLSIFNEAAVTLGFGNPFPEERFLGFQNPSKPQPLRSILNSAAHFSENLVNRQKLSSQELFYSSKPIEKILKDRLRFKDTGEPVMLGDTITGFHTTSFNIYPKLDVAYHFTIKPGENHEGHVSDPDLPLWDPPMCSSAAPTVLPPHQSEFTNNMYEDAAHVLAMNTPMNTVRMRLPPHIQRHGISLGTGFSITDLAPEELKEAAVIARLQRQKGALFISAPQIIVKRQAERDLKFELGEKNAIFINKSLDPASVQNPVRFRDLLSDAMAMNKVLIQQQLDEEGVNNTTIFKSMLRSANRHSAEQIREQMERESESLPNQDWLDARPENLAKIEAFGRTMIAENKATLIQEAKDGLRSAHKKGLITEEFLQERLALIAHQYPNSVRDTITEDSVSRVRRYLQAGWRFLNRQPANDTPTPPPPEADEPPSPI